MVRHRLSPLACLCYPLGIVRRTGITQSLQLRAMGTTTLVKMSSWRRAYSLMALTVVLVTTVPLGSLGARNEPLHQSSSDYILGHKSVKIRFHWWLNRIYLPVRIDKSHLWFAFDTGASDVIDSRVAKILGLRRMGSETILFPHQFQSCDDTTLDHLDIYNLGLDGQNFLICDLYNYQFLEGHQFDGLLGADFAKYFVIKVDYIRSRMTFYDPRHYRNRGDGELVSLTFDRGRYFADTRVEDANGKSEVFRCMIDTGTEFTTIPASALKESGPAIRDFGRLPKIQLGRFTVLDEFAHLGTEFGVCAIGQQTLEHFDVTFDFAQKQMFLSPNKRFAMRDEYEMSGALWKARTTDFHSFEAYKVYPGTPAANAGVQVGDELIAVDGKPASQFTMQDLWKEFSEEGRTCELTVKRGMQIIKLKITLKILI